MSDTVERLVHAFERFPGVGPRQARRFAYYLLAAPTTEQDSMSRIISTLSKEVRRCEECMRFWSGAGNKCKYCTDIAREDTLLMVVEKDQDITVVERAHYKGRYFILGGVLTLSGKGTIREEDLVRIVQIRLKKGLKEVILALSATSEGEHTTDHVREILAPYRKDLLITVLGRGLATGSELEYVDTETLSGAYINRKES